MADLLIVEPPLSLSADQRRQVLMFFHLATRDNLKVRTTLEPGPARIRAAARVGQRAGLCSDARRSSVYGGFEQT